MKAAFGLSRKTALVAMEMRDGAVRAAIHERFWRMGEQKYEAMTEKYEAPQPPEIRLKGNAYWKEAEDFSPETINNKILVL